MVGHPYRWWHDLQNQIYRSLSEPADQRGDAHRAGRFYRTIRRGRKIQAPFLRASEADRADPVWGCPRWVHAGASLHNLCSTDSGEEGRGPLLEVGSPPNQLNKRPPPIMCGTGPTGAECCGCWMTACSWRCGLGGLQAISMRSRSIPTPSAFGMSRLPW